MSNRSVKSVLFSIQLILIALLTLNGQSLVPSNTNDWLQVTDNPNSGGLDSIQVVFFQVPDDYTSPIYFGICDPETNNVSPDNGTGTTFYYLMGGTGCYTDAQSRVLDYGGGTPSNYNTSGNLIYTYEYNNTFTEQNGSAIGGSPDVTTDGEWAYFPYVYASQGEHVGSYYYFRMVVHASTSNKNAYKLVASSLMNTSGPVEITGIRAFAYSWCFDINNYDWDFYPFLPDSLDTTFQTNELDIHTNDADNEEYALYDITGNTRDTAVASSGNDWSSDADGGTNYYLNDGTYGTQIGGTWHIQFDHVNAGVAENTTEFWAYDTTDSLLLPIYTQFYQPPPPYRVTTSVTSDPSVANVPGDYSAVTLQIVDSGGNSVPYARDIYVGNPSDTLSLYYYNGGYVSLGAAGADALITTNTDGYYILYCDNTVTETVTLSFTTDGTNGSDRLPATGALGTNENGTVTHYLATANPPTLTSSGTDLTTLTAGDAPAGILFSITDDDGAFITAANDIYLRIPDSVDAAWDTSLVNGDGTDFTFGGSALGRIDTTVTYTDSKTIRINVTSDFTAAEDTLTIAGGLALTSSNSASLGDFELSYRGLSGPWNVIDSRTGGNDIRISPAAVPYFIWDGSAGDGVFSNNANWQGGTAPVPGAGESVILTSSGTDAVLGGATSYVFDELIITNGARPELGGTASLQVNSYYENSGTWEITGTDVTIVTGTGVFLSEPTLGDVTLNGVTGNVNYGHFDNLTSTAGAWTFPVLYPLEVIIEGDALLTAGSWSMASSQQIKAYGDWTNNGIAITNFYLYLLGSEQSTISGTASNFYRLYCTVPGKQILFDTANTHTVTNSLTLKGTAASPLVLRGTTNSLWSLDASSATVNVSYVDLDWADAVTADISCDFSTKGTNCDTTSPEWVMNTKTTTWTGAVSADITANTPGNWNNGVPNAGDAIIIPDDGTTTNAPLVSTASWDMGTGTITIESGGSLTINNTGFVCDVLTVESGGTLTSNDNDFTVTSDFLIYSGGTANMGNSAITCGTFENEGDLYVTEAGSISAGVDTDTGTTHYSGAGTTLFPLGYAYNNLTIDSGTWDISSALTVNGNVSITGGVLNLSDDLVLTGNFLNSGGAFTQSTPGVTYFTGSTQIISGSNTWFDISHTAASGILRFTDGTTQTVDGDFTVTGTPGNLITLAGTGSAGWNILFNGTVNVSYADISYSTAGPSTYTSSYSQSSYGNNTNWNILSGMGLYVWQGDDATNPTWWSVAANWDVNSVPAAGAQVTIPAAAANPNPVLKADTPVLSTLTLEAGTTLSTYDGTTGDYDLSVSGAVTNNGTLIFTGNETVTLTSGLDTLNGTVRYVTGFAGGVRNISFYTFNNLEINTGGSLAAGANDLVVNGNFIHSGGTLSGTTGNVTVTGQATLGGTISYTGASLIDINGGITSPIAGTVTTTGGSIDISGATPADITFTTGSFNAGTGSIIIDSNGHDILDDGDVTLELTANTITLTNTGTLIGTSFADKLETASPGACTMTLPSGNVSIYIDHTGALNPGFGGNRNVLFPLSLNSSGDMTLPAGVTLGSGTSMLSFVSGGTLTVPTTTSLTTTSGAMTLTGDTLTIPAGAGTITATTTGSISLTQNTGGFTLLRALSGDTGTISINADGGALDLQQTITLTAGSGTTNLVAFGAITQTAAGIITSDAINAETHDGATTGYSITLNQVNHTENLSLESLDGTTGTLAGNLTYIDDGGFTIALLDTNGFADLTCTTGTAMNGLADINQTGAITVGGLALHATGDIYLYDAVNNSIPVLAVTTTGWLVFEEDEDVEIGTVNGLNGLTATDITLIHNNTDSSYTYTIDQTQPVSCTRLVLEGTYGNFDLTGAANGTTWMALYGDAAGTPERVSFSQSGNITFATISRWVSDWTYVDRAGLTNLENLTLDLGAGDLTIDGPTAGNTVPTWEAGGDLSLTCDEIFNNGSTITTGGNVTLDLTTACTLANTWIFDGTTLFTISNSAVSLNDIQLGTATTGGSLSFAGSSTQDINGDVSVLNGAATTWDITNDTLTIAGDVGLANLDVFTVAGSLVTLDGSADQTLVSAIPAGTALPFNNLVISNTAGSGTEVTLADDLTTNGYLTISAGNLDSGNLGTDTLAVGTNLTLSAAGGLIGNSAVDVNGNVDLSGTGSFAGNSRTITVAGNWTETAAVFANSGTSQVTFDGGGASSIATVNALDALSVTNDTTLDLSNGLSCASVTLTNNLGTSTLDTNGAALTVSGGVTGDGTLKTTGAEVIGIGGNLAVGTVTVPGVTAPQISVAGDITLTALTPGNSTFIMNGSTANQDLTSGGESFYNLTINNTFASGTEVTAQDGTIVTGALTLTAGVFDIDGFNLNVTGTFSNDTTLSLTGAGTVTLTSGMDTDSGEIYFDGAGTTLATLTDFYDLTLSGAGARVISLPINVYHDLDASGVTAAFTNTNSTVNFLDDASHTSLFTPPGTSADFTFYDLSVAATNVLSIGGAGSILTIERNWTMNGTLTPGDDRVIFANAGLTSIISGDTAFWDFTCTTAGKNITMTAGDTHTINGVLTLTGTAASIPSSLVTISSSGNWTFNHLGTESVSYAAIEYGQVTGSSIDAANSVDVDLTCDTVAPGWIFGAKTVTWDGSTDTDWFDGTNWDWGYMPNNTDNVIIADVGSQPLILTTDGDITTNDLTINAGATCSLELQDGRDLTINGDFTGNAGSYLTLGDGNTLTFNGTAFISAGNLEFGDGSTFTLNSGTFDNTGDLYREGTSSIDVTDTDSGRTIYRTTAGNLQDYGATDYFNLLIEDTMSLGSAVDAAGALEITGTLNTGGNNLSVGTNLSGTGTLSVNAGAGTIAVTGDTTVAQVNVGALLTPTIEAGGNFSPSTGFTAGASTVEMVGGTAALMGGYTYNNLTINKTAGVIVASTGDSTVSGTLTMTSGEWEAANGTYPNLTHDITGDWDSTGITFTRGSSTIEVDSGPGGTITHTPGEGFNHLTTDGVTGLGSVLEVAGNLLINTGTLTATGNLGITVGGNWTNSGTFDGLSGTVTLSNTGTISGMNTALPGTTDNFYNLSVTGGTRTALADVVVRNLTDVTGGTLDLSVGARALDTPTLNVDTAGTLTTGGTLTVTANAFTLDTGGTVNGSGAIIVTAGDLLINDGNFQPSGTVTVTAGNLNVDTLAAGTMTVGGTLTVTAGTSTFSGGTFTVSDGIGFTSGGLLTVDGGALDTRGTVAANSGLTVSAGTYTAGNAPADLVSVTGNFALSGTGTLGGTGNLTATGNVTLSSANNALTAGDRTVTCGGNWSDTNGVYDPSGGTSTVVMNGAGAVTVTTSGTNFDNLTITNADVTLLTGINCDNDLTIDGSGSLISSGFNLAVTGNIDLTSTVAATIDMTGAGTFSVDGTTDIGASAGITLGNGTADFGNGGADTVTNNGVITSAGTGTITFTENYVGSGGTLTGNAGGNPEWHFDGDASFGTVDTDGDPVWFDGAVTHDLNVNSTAFDTVYIATGGTVSLNDLSAGSFDAVALQIGSVASAAGDYDNGTEFDANSVDFTIGTIDNGGTFNLTGDQGTQVITTFDNDSGWLQYDGGTGAILNNADLADVWNLHISSGTYTLGQDITVNGFGGDQAEALPGLSRGLDTVAYNDEGLFLTGGTLNGGAGDFGITLSEIFSTAGGGTFVPGNSQVNFTGGSGGYYLDAPASGTITFYQLNVSYLAHAGWGAINNVAADASVSGKYLYFNPDATIAVTGYLALSGENTNPNITPPADHPLSPAPNYEAGSTYLRLRPTTNPSIPASPAAGEYWFLDIQAGAELYMENVMVWYSDASSNPFVVQTNVFIYGCIDWFDFVDVLISQTQDSDNNGKIDSILLTTTVALNFDFTNFEATVSGYTVSGYSAVGGNQFTIDLDEKPYLDTGVTPTLQITTNSTLLDSASGTKLVIVPPYTADNSSTQVIADSAPPVVGYTLAVAGRSDMFIHFSEPVESNGGGSGPVFGDLAFTGLSVAANGLNTVTAGGSGGIKEALVQFSGALLTTDITDGDVDAYNGGAPLQDLAGNTMLDISRNNTHAITDLLIGPTNNGPVEPLWARDQTTASSSGAGTGVINEFDNTQHLKDEDITLQAHLNSDYNSAAWVNGNIILRFVQNPGNSYLNGNNLWLDDSLFDETEVSGLATYPVTTGVTSVNGTLADGPTNHVWNFSLSAADITNSQDLLFLFYLPNVGTTPYAGRYAARIEDDTAGDWYRRVYPWSFGIHDIVDQGGGVSILNNVINPLKGEETTLYYNLTKGGMVSVQVFDLAGGLVEILHRGRQDAGEYSLSWNGTNRSNNAVARGIYFVRLVGPGVDEMRKVLVVK